MNLIQSLITPHGGLLATVATLAALALPAPQASAQYSAIGTGLTLEADTTGAAVYRLDMFDEWQGNDLRLVSVFGGEYWLIDSPINLTFASTGVFLTAFDSSATIDSSLSFSDRGLITPGAWSDGLTHYLGYRRQVEETHYYGVLSILYNSDKSLTLSRYSPANPNGLNITEFENSSQVPEPGTAAALLACASIAGVVFRRRSRQQRSKVFNAQ